MTNPTSPQKTVGYIDLLRRNQDFRNLWLAQVISLLGDWFNLIASASLITSLTDSGLAVGALFVVRLLAPFLVSPIAGVVADRYNRKTILLLADIIRGITVLGFLFIRQPEQVWLLYVLTAIQLGISGFFFPTKSAILPNVVSANELGAANAIASATWSVMLAFGAALGGLVAGLFGDDPAFILDSFTFFLSAFFVWRVRYSGQPELGSDQSIRAALQQYLDGLRYLAQKADILVISLQKAANALIVTSGMEVALVQVAEQIYVIGEGGGIGLGIMYGVTGVGTGIGPILARYFTGDDDNKLRWAIGISFAISAVGLFIVSTFAGFGWLLLGITLRGIGGGTVWVFSTQLLLQILPNDIRGRIFATEFAIFSLFAAAGSATSGRLIDGSLGLAGTIRLMSFLALVPCLLWILWVLFGKRETLKEKNVSATD